MPNRLLRDGIIDSRAVNLLSEPAELLYRRLMSIVDDYGRYDADPDLIRARAFPLQLDRWPVARVAEFTKALHASGLITVYSRGTKSYFQIENFGQRLQSKERYPAPTENERKRTTANHRDSPLPTVDHRDSPLSTVDHRDSPLKTVRKNTDVENRADNGIHGESPFSTVNHGEPPCRATRARTETETESYAESETETANGACVPPTVNGQIFAPSARFGDWWQLWSSVKGTSNHGKAETAFRKFVPQVAELDCFECTASYLQSLDNPARGYHPENFLMEQSKEKFQARWPASTNGRKGPSVDELADSIDAFRRTR